jgi:[ribosomal protein S5]-alanine N-acetyltransferase
MTQPWFYTQRLVLRPATADDLDALWALWRDADVRRFLFDDEPVSRERAAGVLDNALAQTRQTQGDLGLWLVLSHANESGGEELLGCVGVVHRIAPPVQHMPEALRDAAIEPVAALYPAHWGWGYAHEALRALLDYVRRIGKEDALMAACDVPNHASDAMLRRLGFEPRCEADGPRGHRLRYFTLATGSTAPGMFWGDGPSAWP